MTRTKVKKQQTFERHAHRPQPIIGEVRPLAEENGAGLQTGNWGREKIKVRGRLVKRCGWCGGAPGSRARKPRMPVLVCGGRCKALTCSHLLAWDGGSSKCVDCRK